MEDPMEDIANDACWEIVFAIRDILWRTDGEYDPDKEWDSDTLALIADVLHGHGLRPKTLVMYEE